MIFVYFNFLLVLRVVESSLVIDSYSQAGIHVSDYCPTMKHCSEGTHILCTSYDPKHEYGPRCNNPQNLTVTAEKAKHLLDVCNAIRSKIAKGKETGKDEIPLPRGYGIFKLKWDSELATFAQILANQCVLKHDLCRSTKKFPNPGQSAGMIQLTIPDWTQLKPTNIPAIDSPGLNPQKILHFVTQILKSWYSTKTSVTKEMIEKYPDWARTPLLNGRLYLDLIHGSTTHMGCGMAAYTNFIYFQRQLHNGKPGGSNFNVVHLVCNWSSAPKSNQPTYLTKRPPSTSACGCPKGTTEDSDCLCIEAEIRTTTSANIEETIEPETCTNPEDNCESTVVLLPIFTVEDAPPEKLIYGEKESYTIDRFHNGSNAVRKSKSMDIFDIFGDGEIETSIEQQPVTHTKSKGFMQMNSDSVRVLSPSVKSVVLSPSSRRNQLELEEVHEPQFSRKSSKAVSPSKKSSIFTRVSKFSLPNGRSNDQYEPIKSNVKPRKDFKNIRRVANEYMKYHNNKLSGKREEYAATKRKDISKTPSLNANVQEKAEIIFNKAEEEIVNVDQYIKQESNASVDYDARQYDENDNKLLNLLDNLEREVKHIELDGNEKKIFDAKIKKIYGSVVGSPTSLTITTKPTKLKPLDFPPSVYKDTNLLKGDIKELESYPRYDTYHGNENGFLTRYDPGNPSNNDRNIDTINVRKSNINHYDVFDREYKFGPNFIKNLDYKGIDDKYAEENNMFVNDPKLVTDLEHQYNDNNYGMSKLEIRYHDDEEQALNEQIINARHQYDDNFNYKYNNNIRRKPNLPAPRSQNNMGKYDHLRYPEYSFEDTKHRRLDKLRDMEPKGASPDIDRYYYRNVDDDREHVKRDSKQKKIYNYEDPERDDPLSLERRKYYQEKINNLKRRLQNDRSYRRRKSDERPNSRYPTKMRPNLEDNNLDRPRSKVQGDSFYLPDRARFLHGF